MKKFARMSCEQPDALANFLSYNSSLTSLLSKSAEPQKEIKAHPITLKKDKKKSCPLLIVEDVTILEPCDNEIVSQYIGSDNIYHRIVSIMKQSTQEYYNMRMVLGLEYK